MLILYFSGTGNSKYIAELFSEKMKAECHSIEEELDFQEIIARHRAVAFCYPIYCSGVPRLMREFACEHQKDLRGKRVIIFCTQMMYSGDGARAFTDLFPPAWFSVVYAEHFFMPNNICNILPTWTHGDRVVKWEAKKANAKMDKVCRNLHRHRYKKRGFGGKSQWLGNLQRKHLPNTEKKALDNVKINPTCIGCGLCVKQCPVGNLTMVAGKVVPQGNCMFCYRCVNLCPRQAITVTYHRDVRRQYKGVQAN